MAAGKGKRRRHPSWIKVRAPFGEGVHELKGLLSGLGLNTVCQEAMCPNLGECWSHGVATFMILGRVCTRGCRYCAVSKGRPPTLDRKEPRRVAEAVRQMGLKHVVVTSVDRDDLEDGGAFIFAETIQAIRELRRECVVEVLIPDFQVERQVNILTLGQYLRPTSWHLPVDRYYDPDEFRHWGETGMRLGFDHVESGPLVRSSYLADRQFAQVRTNTGRAQRAYN